MVARSKNMPAGIAAGGTTVGLGTYERRITAAPVECRRRPIGEQVIGNYGDIYAVAISRNGNDVVTGGGDRTMLLVGCPYGYKLKVLPLSFKAPIAGCRFTTANRIVAISGDTVQVTNAISNAGLIAEISDQHDSALCSTWGRLTEDDYG